MQQAVPEDFTEVPQEKIEEAKKIGSEILSVIEKLSQPQQPLMGASKVANQEQTFASFLPDSIKDRFEGQDISQLEAEGQSFCAISNDDKPALLGSKFGCSVCTTGLYFGIAAIIGGGAILTGGMSIAAVAAAAGYSTTGLAVVISALTGLSTGAVSAIMTGAGITLGVLVLGLCEKMGKC